MSTTKEFIAVQAHIGHKTNLWNPKMRDMIAGKKDNVHILDMDKTVSVLQNALDFLATVKKNSGRVLFVGTKPQAALALRKAFDNDNTGLYVDNKWSAGLLTNFDKLRVRIDQYLNLKEQFATGDIMKYTKREVAEFKKDLEKLDIVYHGVQSLKKLPDAIVILDAVSDRNAVLEALQMKIPVIALCDTNADPLDIAYPIPANDDSYASLEYFVNKFKSV